MAWFADLVMKKRGRPPLTEVVRAAREKNKLEYNKKSSIRPLINFVIIYKFMEKDHCNNIPNYKIPRVFLGLFKNYNFNSKIGSPLIYH